MLLPETWASSKIYGWGFLLIELKTRLGRRIFPKTLLPDGCQAIACLGFGTVEGEGDRNTSSDRVF
ncbi:MAG TPA: hypothetical protein DCP31_29435 [Cyanobacteria bacterium UBA8543]|nr:hypothetical protein [Cyanobacteria bacterium UBA8543]